MRPSLHPVVVFLWMLLLLVQCFTWTHPVYLAVVFMGVIAWMGRHGALLRVLKYLLWGLSLAVFVMCVNPIFSHAGRTILWLGPRLPVVGQIQISVEALAYGAAMGFKMFVVMTVFALYGAAMDMDRAILCLSRVIPKTAITMMMTVMMMPRLRQDLCQIQETLLVRGAPLHQGSWRRRLWARVPILKTVCLSSLEGSWALAEALHTRGFGCARARSCLFPGSWLRQDTRTLLFVFFGFVVYGLCLWQGAGFYRFYPELDVLLRTKDSYFLVGLCLLNVIFIQTHDKGASHV